MLSRIAAGMWYAPAVTRKRSINSLFVAGRTSDTTSKAWSMFAAMMCDSFERFDARRMM